MYGCYKIIIAKSMVQMSKSQGHRIDKHNTTSLIFLIQFSVNFEINWFAQSVLCLLTYTRCAYSIPTCSNTLCLFDVHALCIQLTQTQTHTNRRTTQNCTRYFRCLFFFTSIGCCFNQKWYNNLLATNRMAHETVIQLTITWT